MNFCALLFLCFNFCITQDDESASSSSSPTLFEIYLPYRLEYFAEMKLTSIFPRKFMYTLKDYKKTKETGRPIISMPNCSSGAISLGAVHIGNKQDLSIMLSLMESLSKRVFRTGLNESTAGGNFRLAMNGLGIDPTTRYIYTKFVTNYPTDSFGRFLTFVKSFYYRMSKIKLRYEIYDDIKLDQLVLGRVEYLDQIDLKEFKTKFDDFFVGFVTFNKILVMPSGSKNENLKSVFYFDHMSHEPIIGIENTQETDESTSATTSSSSSSSTEKVEKKKKKKKSK
jgi:hypothetical protein